MLEQELELELERERELERELERDQELERGRERELERELGLEREQERELEQELGLELERGLEQEQERELELEREQECMNTFTYGADVEFLLKNMKTGALVPACGLYGGKKGTPKPAPGYPPGFGIQEDGVTLELNVPVASSLVEFRSNIEQMLRLASELAATRKLAVYEHDSGDYEAENFNADYYPSAFEIGCDPDFLAFGLFPDSARHPPTIESFGTWRFAGGHIHIGYDVDILPPWAMARGVEHYMATILREYRYRNTPRDRHYGMPALYRPKEYGVEYRSLGNSWVLEQVQRELVFVALRNMEFDWQHNRAVFLDLCLNADEPRLEGAG